MGVSSFIPIHQQLVEQLGVRLTPVLLAAHLAPDTAPWILAGNRLEALVRCSLPRFQKSAQYILSATNKNDPFNPGNNLTFSEDFFRVYPDVVATISVSVSTALLAASGTVLLHTCTGGWLLFVSSILSE